MMLIYIVSGILALAVLFAAVTAMAVELGYKSFKRMRGYTA